MEISFPTRCSLFRLEPIPVDAGASDAPAASDAPTAPTTTFVAGLPVGQVIQRTNAPLLTSWCWLTPAQLQGAVNHRAEDACDAASEPEGCWRRTNNSVNIRDCRTAVTSVCRYTSRGYEGRAYACITHSEDFLVWRCGASVTCTNEGVARAWVTAHPTPTFSTTAH
jgi:hypothetical protein